MQAFVYNLSKLDDPGTNFMIKSSLIRESGGWDIAPFKDDNIYFCLPRVLTRVILSAR